MGQAGMYENSVRASIRERERLCRQCGSELDFDGVMMRDVRQIKFTDGRIRGEMYAYCSEEHRQNFKTREPY